MFMVTIDADKCEGCEDCVGLCPAGILGLVDGKAAVVGDPAECMGCMSCPTVCNQGAIDVQEY